MTVVHINTAGQKTDPISCSLSQIMWMLDSFSWKWHPTSPKDMHPFNKSQICTLSSSKYIMCPFWFWRITISLTLLFGYHLLFGRQTVFSQNQRQGNTQQITEQFQPTDKHVGPTKSFSTPTELQNACLGIQNFSFQIFFWFFKKFIIVIFWPCLIKIACYKSFNKDWRLGSSRRPEFKAQYHQ
jgi:hypothetical protein